MCDEKSVLLRSKYDKVTHQYFMPMAIIEVPPHSDDLGSPAEVVPQSQCSFNELQLKEIISSTIIGVQQESIRLVRLELQLQTSVCRRIPLSELGVGVLPPVQGETGRRVEVETQGNQDS